jgi:HlyD family secretion protein
MKRLLWALIAGAVFVGTGAAGYSYLHPSKSTDHSDNYRTAQVRRGDIKFAVTSTGTVQPVQSLQIGSFVSGPIQEIYVDFNAKVKKGQLLARIDPLLFNAQHDQAKAMLDRANADLLQAEARQEQAERDWKRVQKLLPAKAVADTDYDLAKAAYESAKANVAICKATIEQNKGALKLAKTNVDYTKITSPVDGMVTDRKVDPGQTLASQFQTPVMFVIAPDLEKKVHVLASVDEADIGYIRDAQKHAQPVSFTVDAYRKDVFQGRIAQVRLTPTTLQNVVTYTVVVEASNMELKLLPGMTANLKFQIETRSKALKVPNAALRFTPKPREVRESDRKLVEDKAADDKDKRNAESSGAGEAADEDAPAESSRKERYVWIVDGELLAAVKIITGLESSQFTEVVSGELREGQAVVTGMKTH